MTDKQIIIDGIEVYKCRNAKRSIFGIDVECQLGGDCSQRPDCDYKQLKRKEQECEELRKDRERWKSNFNGKVSAIEELLQQLDQLKTENEKYSLFIEKLLDYAGLECDSEEQAMRTLSDLASQMNKARWIIDRYKQTFTEIKELLLKTPTDSQMHCVNAKSVILQKISEVEECEKLEQ